MFEQVAWSLGRSIPWSEQVLSTGLRRWCQPGYAWSGTEGLQLSIILTQCCTLTLCLLSWTQICRIRCNTSFK